MSIEVEYRPDRALNMWVPAEMRETCMRLNRIRQVDERIDSTATYSHFRRFETSGRIVDEPDR